MNDRLLESAIVREVADAAAGKIARKAIRDLQRMNDTMSGDDSGLETTWDEVCVQVQFQHSIFWNAYEDTVLTLVERLVKGLSKHETEAIWLQTNEGFDWAHEEPEDREPYPVLGSDIVSHIVDQHVYAEAARWSNARIRAYISQD